MKREIKGNWRKNFDYRFIAGEDLTKAIQLTIKAIGIEDAFNSRTNEKEEVMVASFIETDKMLVVNKTNAKAISKLAGSQKVEDWKGITITLEGLPDARHGVVTRVKADYSQIKPVE